MDKLRVLASVWKMTSISFLPPSSTTVGRPIRRRFESGTLVTLRRVHLSFYGEPPLHLLALKKGYCTCLLYNTIFNMFKRPSYGFKIEIDIMVWAVD